jgi:hypothetical protein
MLEENLKKIIHKQKEVIEDLEYQMNQIAKNDLIQENHKIKEELFRLQEENKNQLQEFTKMKEENKHLKNTLYEQIYNEKIALLNSMNNKLKVYYQNTVNGEKNRLLEFVKTVEKNIDQMHTILKEHRISAEDEIFSKIESLQTLLDQKLTRAWEDFETKQGAFSKEREAQFKALHSENLSEQELESALKKNNVENFIGLNIINKVGILFLIIGVIAASRYTYFQLGDTLKGIFMFLLGGGLLVGGEFLNRKKPDVFSLGITSAGVAILYTALGLSYFGLRILDVGPAILLCILITLVSFILAIRYHSQTIATFALVGGYIPIFSIAGNEGMVYTGMVYFIVLSIFAFSISVKNKWSVAQFVGFSLNFIATIYITQLILNGRSLDAQFGGREFILLSYIAFAFIVYTLIPMVSTYYARGKFKKPDIVLLGLNTFISAIVMYVVFYQLDLERFTGLLAITFAIIYLFLGRWIEDRMTHEKDVKDLFYLTGFSFVVLIIPFQFGKVWLSLGWLVEGVALATYGIMKGAKSFKKGGLLIFAFSVVSFLIYDLALGVSYELFVYKYFAITLGSIIILYALATKKTLTDSKMKIFKYAVVVNLWIFAQYIIGQKLRNYLSYNYWESSLEIDYLIFACQITITFLIAYSIMRIKALSDTTIKVIGIIFYVLGILNILALNSTSPYGMSIDEVSAPIVIIGTLVLVGINLLSIFALRDFLKFLVLERRLEIEWYPLILSAFFILLLSQNLITQLRLEFNNVMISVLYVIAALSWIVYGFMKRYVFMRRFGLGLSILAIAKLFMLDMRLILNSPGIRILSYFSFGIILIAISFVYQHFSKKLEIIGGILPNDKE